MSDPGVYLYIDTSELNELVDFMHDQLSEQGFDRLMRRTLNEVGKRSKKPIKDAALTEYQAPSRWITGAIKSARVVGGGSQLAAIIPLQNARGASATVFKAGGRRSKGYIPKGRRYKVWMTDVKGRRSVMPYHMNDYGGQPPFINGGKAIMTRAGKARGPLLHVVGVAMPQMPLNLAKKETEDRILKLCEERLIHNFDYMFMR